MQSRGGGMQVAGGCCGSDGAGRVAGQRRRRRDEGSEVTGLGAGALGRSSPSARDGAWRRARGGEQGEGGTGMKVTGGGCSSDGAGRGAGQRRRRRDEGSEVCAACDGVSVGVRPSVCAKAASGSWMQQARQALGGGRRHRGGIRECTRAQGLLGAPGAARSGCPARWACGSVWYG